MAAIDGSPFSDAYMTRIQHNLQQHASMGLEASTALHEFAAGFARRLNQAARGVDMTAPEAAAFRAAWQHLRDEVSAFLDLIPLSNPEQLADMAAQTGKFERKLGALPPVSKPRPPQKAPPVEQQPDPQQPNDLPGRWFEFGRVYYPSADFRWSKSEPSSRGLVRFLTRV